MLTLVSHSSPSVRPFIQEEKTAAKENKSTAKISVSSEIPKTKRLQMFCGWAFFTLMSHFTDDDVPTYEPTYFYRSLRLGEGRRKQEADPG